MSEYNEEGELKIPLDLLNRADLRFFVQVLKNAKVDQVDIYSTDDSIFITASSLITYVKAIMKIPTKVAVYSNVQQIQTNPEEDTDLGFLEEDDSLDIQDMVSNNVNQKSGLAFSTEIGLLEALLIEDKDIEDITLKVTDRIVTLESTIYSLPFPKIRFAPSLGYYMSLMEDKLWEEVDAVAINKVAKTVSSLKVRESDMFISLEKDNIYSDNQDMIINAKSQLLKNYYHFGYETIVAFNKLTMKSPTVKISECDGESFLNVNNMYFVWSYPRNNTATDNIMEMFDVDRMDTIMVVNKEMYKKLQTFLRLIAEKDKNDVVKFVCIQEGFISVICRDKLLKCRGQGKVGTVLEVDLSFLLKAINLTGSDTVIIKANLYSSDVKNILIQGNLDIIIGIESIKKEKPATTPTSAPKPPTSTSNPQTPPSQTSAPNPQTTSLKPPSLASFPKPPTSAPKPPVIKSFNGEV